MRGQASRTAVLVCQGRAAAHDRIAVGRFDDPVAMSLLHGEERKVVDQVAGRRSTEGMGSTDELRVRPRVRRTDGAPDDRHRRRGP